MTFGSRLGSGSFFCLNVGFRSGLGSASGLKKVVGLSCFFEKVFFSCPFLGQSVISLVFF
jgi:hypothetical protein